MKIANIVLRVVVGVTGTIQLLLGLAFWTGNLQALIPVHILDGLLLVLGMWGLAALAFIARSHVQQAVVVVVWGLVMPAFGMAQSGILVGGAHWVVQVLHLLVGIGAVGIAQGLAGRLGGRPAPVVQEA